MVLFGSRGRWLRCFTAVAAGMLAVALAHGEPYPDPSRPLKVIVPFGAASSTDILARALARGIADVSGITVIVENKAGAEGQIGMAAGKSATPDGYTMVMTTSSTQVVNPHMLPNLAYDPVADFIPIAGIAKFGLIMNVGPSFPQGDFKDFLRKARENPGKYTFGSGTTTTRLAAELLQSTAAIKLLSVPYKSQTEAVTGLAGGQVDVVFMDLPGSTPHLKSGRVRALGVTGATRMTALPTVPTLQEGGVAGYEVTGWWGIYFPAKTPAEIVKVMRNIVQQAAGRPAVKEVFQNFGLEPLPLLGEDLTAFQKADSQRWAKVVRDANLAGK